ncbi:ribonuclease HI family protein [Comamonas endophytica]|uniref:Ribonuclease HI family protein n=1 Tax=Comamonas endophytica TaxID=2949090 RepID=A0ABY6GG61_9BURK|nr:MULTISPECIES: ribonuclease HI family protein [unclassified Acidovorax]MCD2513329.1 ribonuclease HI family protein [Acidovorax sp. D4N7]UYG53886.1 ribonuclease HI family protein [Acidovorax sp. 5MLIR]
MDARLWTVYIDGSAFPNPGRMCIGGIAHAPDGSSRSFSQALAGSGCNNEAEALAAIHMLQWLHAQGARAVLLHTDSSILAEQLGRPSPKRIERLAAVYDQARALVPLFDSLRVQWIPRHRNAVADALARAGALPANADRQA